MRPSRWHTLRTHLLGLEERLYVFLLPAARKRRQQGRLRMGKRELPPHILTGERGEEIAYFHLLRAGYTVVARRWFAPGPGLRGDLDLVAWHGETLVIVEVKTRSQRDLYPAEIAVNRGKRNQLRKLARAFVRSLPLMARAQAPLRFDVVSVYLDAEPPLINHFERMFPFEDRSDE